MEKEQIENKEQIQNKEQIENLDDIGLENIELNQHNNLPLVGDVKEIYVKIKPITFELIGDRKLSANLFRPLLIKLIRVIQDYTENKYGHLEGSQKKEIALSVLDYIIKDLKRDGKISDEVADSVLIGLELMGPAIIDFAAAFVKKILSVAEDISDNGCNGCWSRNFKNKNKNKK